MLKHSRKKISQLFGPTLIAVTACFTILLGVQSVCAEQPVKATKGQIPVRYTDVREAAGITFRQDSTQTDDKYGWLDLVVTNYIEWSPKNNMWCGEHRPGYRSYCHPGNYKGQRIKLYHNNHDGTFTDVSDASGVGKPEAKGMGVVLADLNNDGWPDISVANDSWPNFLFINKHECRFACDSAASGNAVR